MTRGNQREADRAKAQAKLAAGGKKKEGSVLQRREADAKAIQDKLAAKQARLAAEAKAIEEAKAKGLPVPVPSTDKKTAKK